jgi:hypothetical protein
MFPYILLDCSRDPRLLDRVEHDTPVLWKLHTDERSNVTSLQVLLTRLMQVPIPSRANPRLERFPQSAEEGLALGGRHTAYRCRLWLHSHHWLP